MQRRKLSSARVGLLGVALLVALVCPGPAAAQPRFPTMPPRPPITPPIPPGPPGMPGGPRGPGFPDPLERVWSCSGCNAELGRGPVKPLLDRCPQCGVKFINGLNLPEFGNGGGMPGGGMPGGGGGFNPPAPNPPTPPANPPQPPNIPPNFPPPGGNIPVVNVPPAVNTANTVLLVRVAIGVGAVLGALVLIVAAVLVFMNMNSSSPPPPRRRRRRIIDEDDD